MVDRASRTKAGELLRHLVSGQVTNDDFEDRMPLTSADPVIVHMYVTGWCLYSDQRSYRLIGPDRVTPDARQDVARCVLFLRTNLEYEWPRESRMQSLVRVLGSLLTAGYANRLAQRRFARHGDVEVWPFIRRSDYQAALDRATSLGGSL